jgi:hypothetical protein
MRNVIVFVVALTVFGGRFVAAEDSLADAAAKEKERRKGQKAPKVITEGDLLDAKGRSLSATEDNSQPAPAAGAPAGKADGKTADGKKAPVPKTDEEIRADKQKDWHTRHDAAAAEVNRLSQVVSDLQASVGQYSSDVLKNHLADAQKALEAAQAKAAQLEDERRYSGFQ